MVKGYFSLFKFMETLIAPVVQNVHGVKISKWYCQNQSANPSNCKSLPADTSHPQISSRDIRSTNDDKSAIILV